MKRKGFALVELLAVIVILAVIAIIATPIVINMIESSRQGATIQNVNGILKAAEKFYVYGALGSNAQEMYSIDLESDTKLEYKGVRPEKMNIVNRCN